MTHLDLDRLGELEKAATFGGKLGWACEWHSDDAGFVIRRHDRVIVAEQVPETQGRFIVALVNAAPSLLAAVRAAMDADLPCQAYGDTTTTCIDVNNDIREEGAVPEEELCDFCRIYEATAPFMDTEEGDEG